MLKKCCCWWAFLKIVVFLWLWPQNFGNFRKHEMVRCCCLSKIKVQTVHDSSMRAFEQVLHFSPNNTNGACCFLRQKTKVMKKNEKRPNEAQAAPQMAAGCFSRSHPSRISPPVHALWTNRQPFETIWVFTCLLLVLFVHIISVLLLSRSSRQSFWIIRSVPELPAVFYLLFIYQQLLKC